MNFHQEVYQILSEITEMLVAKNQKYGNSAIEPLGIFSDLSPEEGPDRLPGNPEDPAKR